MSKNKKIAWIEDDIGIIEDVVQPLKNAGFEFQYLQSIKDATDNVETLKKVDLILLDLIYPAGYPDSDYDRYPGVIFLERLRNEFNINIPVVVFTVVTSDKAHKRLYDLGVADIVNKPIKPSKLKEIVEKALGMGK